MIALFTMMALATQPPPSCRLRQLGAVLDPRSGDYNGMSHSGTLVVLHNRGAACRIVALPRITFSDGSGRLLPILRRPPPGMHPGPAMIPITIPAGGTVSTPLRWISGQVFDAGRCLHPAHLVVAMGRQQLALVFGGTICGPSGEVATFDQPPLRLGIDSDRS